MDCSDHIVLQRLLDGELDEAQAELVSHHLESCAHCRAVTRHLAAVRAFVGERLGAEDEEEEDAAAAALAAVAARLPAPSAAERASRRRRTARTRWLRGTWLAATAATTLALLLPLAFSSRVGAAADRILGEAVSRERMWRYQPNKVLQWEVNTVSTGVKGIDDGTWRSVYWQKNGSATFEQVWRQYGPKGLLTGAFWRKDDGSVINYRPNGPGVVEILPSTAEARAALPALSPELRGALASYLERRETGRTLDFQSRRQAEWLNRPVVGTSRAEATLKRGVVAEWGEVYHITLVTTPAQQAPSILHAVHEYDVEKSSYRLLQLKTTLTYTDGTTGTHDSRWVTYREATEAEFEAHAPRELLEEGRHIVHLTPLELATRHLQELNRARTSPN